MLNSSIIISLEEVTAQLLDEMLPLLERHRQELSAFPDMPLNVDYERYVMMQKLGLYRAYIMRDNGIIIGYVAYYVNSNMHYSDYLYAAQDVLYVEPTRRGAMLGKRLLTYAEDSLRDDFGVNVVTQHVKIKKDIGRLLIPMGYDPIETIYMRRLR